MSSSHSEKFILGIAFQHPELIPVIQANAPGLFSEGPARVTWNQIDELFGPGDPVNIAIVGDALWGKVPMDWLHSCLDGVAGMGLNHAETELKKTIAAIKKDRMIRRLQEKVAPLTTFTDIDKKEIDQIFAEAELHLVDIEASSFSLAEEEYVTWKEMKRTNITTGFPSFDKVTDHFNYGELIAIMGRTTTGKTFCALNILDNLVSRQVEGLGFFSMEMSKATLVERIMQINYGLSRNDLVLKRNSKEIDSTEVSERYKNVKIYSKVYSVDEIARIIERDKLRVIMIDYLQLVKGDAGYSLYEKTTYRMHELKALAKNKNCAIFLLVQLSRKGEGGWEPVTIDMARDSGAIEENSDFIIGMWNPNLRDFGDGLSDNKICVKLLKNKRGPIKGIECVFNPETGKLYEV